MRCVQKLDSLPSWSCILLIRADAWIPTSVTLLFAIMPKEFHGAIFKSLKLSEWKLGNLNVCATN
jgi:hypothetical protein